MNESTTIVTAMTPFIIEILRTHGAVITVLAIFGAFALFKTAMTISLPILEVFGIVFIITPIIMIQSWFSKKKKYTMVDEVKDILRQAARSPKAVITFFLYIIGIVFAFGIFVTLTLGHNVFF